MWHEDLTEYDFFGRKLSKKLFGENYSTIPIAIGWLEYGKPYKTGIVPEGLCEKLYEFFKTREISHYFLGVHACDLCEIELPPTQLHIIAGLGSRTTFLAYRNTLYIFPDLIVHYINTHNYLPPSGFIEAVLSSTPQETIEYFKQISLKWYS